MTIQTSFVHIRNTPNTGDLHCTPFDYFYFPEARVYDINSSIPKSHTVIYGGGAIEPKLRTDKIHHNVEAKYKIAWGVGTSLSGRSTSPELVDDMDLVGRREWGRKGGIYVPCVSCMSDLFDKKYEIDKDVIVYAHAVKPGVKEILEYGFPTLNNRAPFKDVIESLGSAETIITNSFHGAYWGTLLNRKVICVPFSSKFYGYKHTPLMIKGSGWKESLSMGVNYPDALSDARTHNICFYNRVMDLIS
ncbi:hypothetical protein ACTG2T_16885 [Aeromonas sp. 75A]|uniref:hypothetical protein n=1 Tax=unclassified Aeromonas TaxID=257493 RepID=UPI002E7ABB74|nr:hypothetical protein [Aeromonas sp. 43P]MEE1953437.1 hypothetical protein [Aeromonas sp. 43P]